MARSWPSIRRPARPPACSTFRTWAGCVSDGPGAGLSRSAGHPPRGRHAAGRIRYAPGDERRRRHSRRRARLSAADSSRRDLFPAGRQRQQSRRKFWNWIAASGMGPTESKCVDRSTFETAMIAVQGPQPADLAAAAGRRIRPALKYYGGDDDSICSAIRWPRQPHRLHGRRRLGAGGAGRSGGRGLAAAAGHRAGRTGAGRGPGLPRHAAAGSAMPLYGHELSEAIHPFQAGLRFRRAVGRSSFPRPRRAAAIEGRPTIAAACGSAGNWPASALPREGFRGPRRRPRGRTRHQRHILADAQAADRHGICASRPSPAGDRNVDRHSRPTRAGDGRQAAVLSPAQRSVDSAGSFLNREPQKEPSRDTRKTALRQNARMGPRSKRTRLASTIATVGISAFAVEALTDLVYIELPAVGRKVKPANRSAKSNRSKPSAICTAR